MLDPIEHHARRGSTSISRCRPSAMAGQRPVVVLNGALQTGKTSLVRRLFARHRFVSLDLPSEAEQAEKDPRGFLARHPPPLILDEVQYAPGIFRHLKAEVDAARERNGQLVLTAPRKLTLMAAVAESLAGRAAVLALEGLSSGEITGAAPSEPPEAAAARARHPAGPLAARGRALRRRPLALVPTQIPDEPLSPFSGGSVPPPARARSATAARA